MNTTFLKHTLLWGVVLWFIGYLLGFILFMLVPQSWIGWIISPFGIIITLWVLREKMHMSSFTDYVTTGFIWTFVAIVMDYFFLVKLLKPADGYYKLDVYLYYFVTFTLPILFGWKKRGQSNTVPHSKK